MPLASDRARGAVPRFRPRHQRATGARFHVLGLAAGGGRKHPLGLRFGLSDCAGWTPSVVSHLQQGAPSLATVRAVLACALDFSGQGHLMSSGLLIKSCRHWVMDTASGVASVPASGDARPDPARCAAGRVRFTCSCCCLSRAASNISVEMLPTPYLATISMLTLERCTTHAVEYMATADASAAARRLSHARDGCRRQWSHH
jgi:hypothetical protein